MIDIQYEICEFHLIMKGIYKIGRIPADQNLEETVNPDT